MKKLVVLAVLILALSASIVGASPWTTTLTSTTSLSTITLNASATPSGSNWLWTYDVTFNPSTASSTPEQVTSFQIYLGSALKALATPQATAGWTLSTVPSDVLLWNANSVSDVLKIGHTQASFSYIHPWGPVDWSNATGQGTAKLISKNTYRAAVWEGDAPVPTVPEASTLVGFGSALAMAGPGIVGWLRRRRA